MIKNWLNITICVLLMIFSSTENLWAKSKRTKHHEENKIEYSDQESVLRYYFYEAKRCFDNGEYDRAIALFLYCESINPNEAAVENYIGTIYEMANALSLAHKHYIRAYTIEPSMYWESYVRSLLNLQDMDKVMHVLSDINKLEPKNTDALAMQKQIFMYQGEYKKALKIMDKRVAVEGMTESNAYDIHELYLYLNKPKKALEVIDNYLASDPTNLAMRNLRCETYLYVGDEAKALECFKEELTINPDNPYSLYALSSYFDKKGNKDLAASYARACLRSQQLSMYEKLRYLKGLESQLRAVEAMYETTMEELIDDYPLEVSLYQKLVNYYMSVGNQERALSLAQTLLDIAAEDNNSWQSVLYIMGEDSTTTNEAYTEFFKRAYEQFPNDSEWCYWQARAYVVEGDYTSALEICQRNEEMTGEVVYKLQLMILAGDIYSLLGNREKKYAAYEAVLAIDNDNIYVLNNYAYSLAIDGGDLKRAEQMSRKTIEAEPNNATYLDTYAWILYLRGEEFLAKYYIKQAINNMTEEESEEIREHYEEIFKDE